MSGNCTWRWIFFAFPTIACHGGPREETSWADTSSAYGFSYVTAAPEGKHLQVIVAKGVHDACSLFRDDDDVREFEFVRVVLHGNSPGTYVIGPDDGRGAVAEVTLVRVSDPDGKTRRPATAGTVILSAPSENVLEVQIDARLATTSVRSECEGGSGPATTSPSCRCEPRDGAAFTCTLKVGEDSCCEREADGGEALSVLVASHYCPALCSEVAGLGVCDSAAQP